MKATILDMRSEKGTRCYLCKVVLEDYIKELPSTYREYPIQREIVRNIYLDELVKTVLYKKHIPPIVLVVEDGSYTHSQNTLDIKDFKILDGLQRTHRLKIIYDTALFYMSLESVEKNDLANMGKFAISRKYSSALRRIGSSTDILFAFVEFNKQVDNADILDSFRNNFQWFEVWTNLTLEQEVQKMLVLNAGHKPVNTRHQLELLFLNILPSLKATKYPSFTVVREKELSSTAYSKSRIKGQFHFAHLIAALLSYSEGAPVTTNTNLIQSLQSEPIEIEQRSEVLSLAFLDTFVSFLLDLDTILEKQYGQQGIQWLGREVALVGLFGGLGHVRKEREEDAKKPLKDFLAIIEGDPRLLNLSKFEEERNALDLSRVNIGNVNKTSVYQAVMDLMLSDRPRRIQWEKYFQGSYA